MHRVRRVTKRGSNSRFNGPLRVCPFARRADKGGHDVRQVGSARSLSINDTLAVGRHGGTVPFALPPIFANNFRVTLGHV